MFMEGLTVEIDGRFLSFGARVGPSGDDLHKLLIQLQILFMRNKYVFIIKVTKVSICLQLATGPFPSPAPHCGQGSVRVEFFLDVVGVLKAIGVDLTLKIYLPLLDPGKVLGSLFLWNDHTVEIFIRKLLFFLEPALHHPPPLILVEIKLFLNLAFGLCLAVSENSDQALRYFVDNLAVLTGDKFKDRPQVGQDSVAIGTGHEEKAPETHDDQVFQLEDKEHDDDEDAHFAEQVDEVDQDCFVVAEKKFLYLLVKVAIIDHTVLKKQCIVLWNDQSVLRLLVALNSHQFLEEITPAKVEEQPRQEDGHLEVVDHQSQSHANADGLIWVLPRDQVDQLVVDEDEGIESLCEVVNQLSYLQNLKFPSFFEMVCALGILAGDSQGVGANSKIIHILAHFLEVVADEVNFIFVFQLDGFVRSLGQYRNYQIMQKNGLLGQKHPRLCDNREFHGSLIAESIDSGILLFEECIVAINKGTQFRGHAQHLTDLSDYFFTLSRNFIFPLQLKVPLIFLRSRMILIYIMQNLIEKIQLRPGNYYHIFHQRLGKVLMVRDEPSNEYVGKAPIIGDYNDINLNQVWMIEYIREKKLHQMVHALSTLVLESTVKACKLSFGNWSYGQHYIVKNADGGQDSNAFTIRDRDNPNLFLYADRDGIIQLGQKKDNDPDIRWILRLAQKTRAITQSVLFENAFTNMTIDVPEASSKPGVKVVQYPINKRFNQRFRLIFNNQTNTYFIENVKSRLVLELRDENAKEGVNIVQQKRGDGLHQRWYLQNQGKDLYLIRSAMKAELFIGIKNNEFKECAQLVTTKKEDFALWRILGQFQRQEYSLV